VSRRSPEIAAMADETTIPSHYVQAFQSNLNMVPQQTQARLVSRVDSILNFDKPGDMFNADDLGKTEPTEILERFGPSPENALEKSRRVGFFTPYEDGQFLDDVDTAKSLSDPSNMTMQAMMAGRERYRDREIISALGRAARTGRNGENSVALPAAQIVARNSWAYSDINLAVAPSGNAGLTLSKLTESKVKLDKAELIGGGEKTFVASATQLGNLLRDKTITSSDYAAVKALINGEISSFMGWTFVQSELLPLAASIRTCYGFVKSAVMYRDRTLTAAQIVRRPDRKFNWYAYYKGMHGAVRRLDEGVVAVLCDEA
jgi:hypothetical protein